MSKTAKHINLPFLNNKMLTGSTKIKLRELVVLTVFGVIIFLSKLLLEFLPNFHLITMFIITLTVVYKAKALISINIFVFLTIFLNGLNLWTIPYLYIWLYPFILTLILPKRLSDKASFVLYIIIAVSHGFLYGTLYAPFQSLAFGLNFKATIAWIITGLPWDFAHGVYNGLISVLILPLTKLLKKII